MRIKRNKFLILALLVVLLLIILSFVQYYNENFSYWKDYYTIKENCYEKKDINHSYCDNFRDEENLKLYIEVNDPYKEYKQLDAITLTCTIVELTVFNVLQLFSPLLIIITIIGMLHAEFSSGMFKNYLLRINYKDYLKKTYKTVFKVSLIIPMALLFVFVISCFITQFNFSVASVNKSIAVYNEWKYHHFLLYGSCICLIQFFISILYANIGLYCCRKNKSKIVAVIMGYILFLLINLFIYMVVYVIFINKILGFKNLTDWFNIAGYWFFYNKRDCFAVVGISFLIQLISTVLLYKSYSRKERVIESHEAQNA